MFCFHQSKVGSSMLVFASLATSPERAQKSLSLHNRLQQRQPLLVMKFYIFQPAKGMFMFTPVAHLRQPQQTAGRAQLQGVKRPAL